MAKDSVGLASDCQGKQPFPSKQAIFKIFSRPGREKPMAYHCKMCGHYHVSHTKKKFANRKSLGRYINERKKYFESKKPCLVKT